MLTTLKNNVLNELVLTIAVVGDSILIVWRFKSCFKSVFTGCPLVISNK
ncbi:hypothetical protein [Spiroplasma endosymbiont of Virgichneumon dumeticola]